MRNLLKIIEQSGCSKLGKVLHLGCGACSELDIYVRLRADEILLVEADHERATKLRTRINGVKRVDLVEAAVAPHDGQATFWLLNNKQENSLVRPTRLLELYPNVRVVSSISINATTINQLVERLAPNALDENLLVMELSGAELPILSVTPLTVLHNFAWIALRNCNTPLCDHISRHHELDAWLCESGFQRAGVSAHSSYPPFAKVLYQRDREQARRSGLLKSQGLPLLSKHKIQSDCLLSRIANLKIELTKLGEPAAG